MLQIVPVLLLLLAAQNSAVTRTRPQNPTGSIPYREERFDYIYASIASIQRAIRSGTMTCEKLTRGYLRRINRYNPEINASIRTLSEYALIRARELDAHYARTGRSIGRLHCVPTLVKDNIDIAGIPTTVGMRFLQDMTPNTSASVTERLYNEGAVFVSKANMAKFAMGEKASETGGLCHNPYDLGRTCSGSSFGPGSGIASSFGVVAIGSDTIGSLVVPSSMASLTCIRPTRTELDLSGVFPLIAEMDTIGPMTKYMEDSALTLDVMLNRTRYSRSSLLDREALRNASIGVLADSVYGLKRFLTTKDVQKIMQTTVRKMQDYGARIKNVTLTEKMIELLKKHLDLPLDLTEKCLKGWVLSYLDEPGKYPNRDGKFRRRVVNEFQSLIRVELEQDVSVAKERPAEECRNATAKFDRNRRVVQRAFEQHFLRDVDMLMMPTASAQPHLIGKETDLDEENTLNFIFEVTAPYTGYPSINLPAGFTKLISRGAPQGLPVGALLFSTPDKLPKMISVAYSYQENFGIFRAPYTTPPLDSCYTVTSGSPSLKVLYYSLVLCPLAILHFLFVPRS